MTKCTQAIAAQADRIAEQYVGKFCRTECAHEIIEAIAEAIAERDARVGTLVNAAQQFLETQNTQTDADLRAAIAE